MFAQKNIKAHSHIVLSDVEKAKEILINDIFGVIITAFDKLNIEIFKPVVNL